MGVIFHSKVIELNVHDMLKWISLNIIEKFVLLLNKTDIVLIQSQTVKCKLKE